MPKIIQILQGNAGLTGLGDDGVVYTVTEDNEWREWIKPLPKTVKKRSKPFQKPTIPELESQFMSVHDYDSAWCWTEESQKFYDHYESNGWKVGKNPMKDWKAAVRNWLKNVEKRNETRKPNQSLTEQVAAANGISPDFSTDCEGYSQSLALDGEVVRS